MLEFSQDWTALAIDEFRTWAERQKARDIKTVTVEMFRAQAKHQPDTHKAWGVLPRLLCKAELIAAHTDARGRPLYQRAASPRTHAHPVRLWRLR